MCFWLLQCNFNVEMLLSKIGALPVCRQLYRCSGLYISNVYVGGFACIFASVYIANIGQEMV